MALTRRDDEVIDVPGVLQLTVRSKYFNVKLAGHPERVFVQCVIGSCGLRQANSHVIVQWKVVSHGI